MIDWVGDGDGDGDGLGFLGRSPFGQWTQLHDLLAERAREFLASLGTYDRQEFEQKLDGYLTLRARTLGCRRLPGRQPRWIMPSGSSPGILSDVDLLATSFEDGAAGEELRSLLREVRPLVATEPETKRAASDERLALTVLLGLLEDRAARSFDGEAVEKADAILSSQAGALCTLAWRGAGAVANEERLRAQAPKAAAARTEKAAAHRKLIRDQLEHQRADQEGRRGAPKRAAYALQDHPSFKGLAFDNLVDRCRKVASAEFPDWE